VIALDLEFVGVTHLRVNVLMTMARGLLSLTLALFALFRYANSTNNPSLSACYCRPVINVAIEGNQCDLCAANKQLLQEVNGLKKELETIKNRISTTQPGKWGVDEYNKFANSKQITSKAEETIYLRLPHSVVSLSQWNLSYFVIYFTLKKSGIIHASRDRKRECRCVHF